ncbi:unnamed protein product [Cyprideis torosa]|uniref:Uncharacterized protein n=1 Tax=Cyprideis torosa TaxID=163714 RepID=A0A7R8ZMI4_9CRUS|nr:unnamed protein product [Cyprideis torosa]CAG0885905.1 unnamed protein product [Cyprideis torosa]
MIPRWRLITVLMCIFDHDLFSSAVPMEVNSTCKRRLSKEIFIPSTDPLFCPREMRNRTRRSYERRATKSFFSNFPVQVLSYPGDQVGGEMPMFLVPGQNAPRYFARVPHKESEAVRSRTRATSLKADIARDAPLETSTECTTLPSNLLKLDEGGIGIGGKSPMALKMGDTKPKEVDILTQNEAGDLDRTIIRFPSRWKYNSDDWYYHNNYFIFVLLLILCASSFGSCTGLLRAWIIVLKSQYLPLDRRVNPASKGSSLSLLSTLSDQMPKLQKKETKVPSWLQDTEEEDVTLENLRFRSNQLLRGFPGQNVEKIRGDKDRRKFPVPANSSTLETDKDASTGILLSASSVQKHKEKEQQAEDSLKKTGRFSSAFYGEDQNECLEFVAKHLDDAGQAHSFLGSQSSQSMSSVDGGFGLGVSHKARIAKQRKKLVLLSDSTSGGQGDRPRAPARSFLGHPQGRREMPPPSESPAAKPPPQPPTPVRRKPLSVIREDSENLDPSPTINQTVESIPG